MDFQFLCCVEICLKKAWMGAKQRKEDWFPKRNTEESMHTCVCTCTRHTQYMNLYIYSHTLRGEEQEERNKSSPYILYFKHSRPKECGFHHVQRRGMQKCKMFFVECSVGLHAGGGEESAPPPKYQICPLLHKMEEIWLFPALRNPQIILMVQAMPFQINFLKNGRDQRKAGTD